MLVLRSVQKLSKIGSLRMIKNTSASYFNFPPLPLLAPLKDQGISTFHTLPTPQAKDWHIIAKVHLQDQGET